MTLPAIISKKQSVETITRLKRSYSILSQAFKMAEVKNGTIDSWTEWDDAEEIINKYLIPEIKGAKSYGKAQNSVLALCYDENSKLHSNANVLFQYSWMDGVHISSPFFTEKTASFLLQDGSCIGLNPKDVEVYVNNVFVDVNGPKPPNIAGEDLFFFTIDNNALRPYGYNWNYEDMISSSVTNACNRKSFHGGFVCAARVISDGWQIKY